MVSLLAGAYKARRRTGEARPVRVLVMRFARFSCLLSETALNYWKSLVSRAKENLIQYHINII
jgi:hypothetical protein